MTLVGVISDTHGLLRPEAVAALSDVEHIIHAGDIGGPDVVGELQKIAPVTAIRGNVDRGVWADAYSDTETVILAGHTIHVVHNRNDLDFDPIAAGVDLVISGHSHKPSVETIDGVLYLNPGSAGPRRFTLPIALATLDLGSAPLSPRIHEIVP